MLTKEAISHFGNMSKVARALGVSRATVWKWNRYGGVIPADYAAKLHVMTSGKLHFSVQEYGSVNQT